ncbi:MAG: Uma2 family endonuclease [Planctomycetota bacterium]
MTHHVREDVQVPESRIGEPVWALALQYPRQGDWTADDYFALEIDRRVELSNGCLEFLPVPSLEHQLIVAFLYEALLLFVKAGRLGVVVPPGLRVRNRAEEEKAAVREPDIAFLSTALYSKLPKGAPASDGADLVMEVVSPQQHHRERDIVDKRGEYARTGIPEYWIVDPEERQVTVLTLAAGANEYTEHGVFKPGEMATSVVLPGFEVNVTDALEGMQP